MKKAVEAGREAFLAGRIVDAAHGVPDVDAHDVRARLREHDEAIAAVGLEHRAGRSNIEPAIRIGRLQEGSTTGRDHARNGEDAAIGALRALDHANDSRELADLNAPH